MYDWGYNALTYIFSADITPEMLKLGRVTKVKVFFLVLVYVFNIDQFEFSGAILEKALITRQEFQNVQMSRFNLNQFARSDIVSINIKHFIYFRDSSVYLTNAALETLR